MKGLIHSIAAMTLHLQPALLNVNIKSILFTDSAFAILLRSLQLPFSFSTTYIPKSDSAHQETQNATRRK